MAVPHVTVFADFTCPFCYVTEAALRRVVDTVGATAEYRAYELYPAPAPAPAPADEKGWREAVEPVAARLDLPLEPPTFRPRTAKAHEAARFAAERGAAAAFRDAVYRAFWGDGRDIGRIDVLQEAATQAGLDPLDLKIALDIDRFREAVLHDADVAARLRIPGVPTLYVGRGRDARALVGAQTLEALEEALRG